MYQLSYQSNANESISSGDIQSILETARKRNKELGITGCLVFHNSCFVQILEGKKKHVKSVFQDIKGDKRHCNVKLLWKGKVEERGFNDWSMGYYDSTNEGANSADVKVFEQNLIMLSELSQSSSATVSMFWVRVRKLMLGGGC
ncbi:BLUF domain-containing protein [Arenibacter latericius]|uniref:BLUF domain-containing protein n=1 Tax=Arenibacter latericius TaxID=86104 RepID=UPI0004200F25|nr:BLUF domain-containing protein [Arenibacter latericius]